MQTGLRNNWSHYYKTGLINCHESKQKQSIAFILCLCKQREMQARSYSRPLSVAAGLWGAAKADCNAADFTSMKVDHCMWNLTTPKADWKQSLSNFAYTK